MGLKSKHKINSYIPWTQFEGLFLFFYRCVCAWCICVGACATARVWQPEAISTVFSFLFEGSEVRILAAKLVPQELYPLRHLIGLSLKQFYTIVLAYIVFCLRPIRRDQLGIFFHTWAKFWTGNAQYVSFFSVLLLTFLFCILCNFKYTHFVIRIKLASSWL